MRSFWRRRAFAFCYGAALTLALGWVLLDTFVIPRAVSCPDRQASDAFSAIADETPAATAAKGENEAATDTAATDTAATDQGEASPSAAVTTQNSYRDEHIAITITTATAYNTTYYAADIQLDDPSYLRTALAQGVYGRNIKAATSDIAAENGAILAVNGDYYGFRNNGYVLRNGVLYRRQAGEGDLLMVNRQGDFITADAAALSPEKLASGEWWQVFSFGPTLVENGEVAVTQGDEVGRAKASNPRTAIGQVDSLHYVFLVSDGRTSASEGLSLCQLAEVMQSLNCKSAYNLDGGGSSTMVFMGRVVNTPTANGRTITQREVSDIVYIGV